jgi:GxxExxY protein
MSQATFKHGGLTHKIIGAAFEVHRVLGYGFLEKVYKLAMQVELQHAGLSAELEAPLDVFYKTVNVGIERVAFKRFIFSNQ